MEYDHIITMAWHELHGFSNHRQATSLINSLVKNIEILYVLVLCEGEGSTMQCKGPVRSKVFLYHDIMDVYMCEIINYETTHYYLSYLLYHAQLLNYRPRSVHWSKVDASHKDPVLLNFDDPFFANLSMMFNSKNWQEKHNRVATFVIIKTSDGSILARNAAYACITHLCCNTL